MRAITILPGVPHSARLDDIPEPPVSEGMLAVQAVALGVCATDREIIAGNYGSAPPGQERLVLGHESLGRVEEAPSGSGFERGDLVVGIVRRPDPVPCPACAVGEWDMCQNGRFTERGIKRLDGFGAERFQVEPEYAIKVDPLLGFLGVLLEPASVVAKAWDHTERIGKRSRAWTPKVLVVTGAGPIGLLAALMGVQRSLQLHVFDRNQTGSKSELVCELGGRFHTDMDDIEALSPDIVMECTGAAAIAQKCLDATAPGGILCLVGVSAPGQEVTLDLGLLNRTMVLRNKCVFGTVNANRRHYEIALDVLMRADKRWLGQLITRRVPLARFAEALERRPGDIKVIIDFLQ
jgi:threonine dehydrogenase-like Zn-dependent dehydrogenase